MSDEEKAAETPVSEPECPGPAQSPEPLSRQRERRRRKSRSVIFYVTVLFLVAILLLVLSYFMQQRKIDSMSDDISGIRDSVSAMQEIQDIEDENQSLKSQNADLSDQLAEANSSLSDAQSQADADSKTISALDYFWRIDELYSTRYYSAARTLIQEFRSAGLESSLPDVVYTTSSGTGAQSVSARYQEILAALY